MQWKIEDKASKICLWIEIAKNILQGFFDCLILPKYLALYIYKDYIPLH